MKLLDYFCNTVFLVHRFYFLKFWQCFDIIWRTKFIPLDGYFCYSCNGIGKNYVWKWWCLPSWRILRYYFQHIPVTTYCACTIISSSDNLVSIRGHLYHKWLCNGYDVTIKIINIRVSTTMNYCFSIQFTECPSS